MEHEVPPGYEIKLVRTQGHNDDVWYVYDEYGDTAGLDEDRNAAITEAWEYYHNAQEGNDETTSETAGAANL